MTGDSFEVEGMTQNLIELLTTLVQRQNLHEVVRQGIVPLMSTVAAYMIVPANRESYHRGDYSYFIYEKSEDVYKERSIRNSCLDLVSSLIEVFGDEAVEALLTIINSLIAVPSALKQTPDDASTKSEISTAGSQQSLDDVNIFEANYVSQNKKH